MLKSLGRIHRFISDDLGGTEWPDWCSTANRTTDAHLLMLAQHHGLATWMCCARFPELRAWWMGGQFALVLRKMICTLRGMGNASTQSSHAASRIWYTLGGILSIFVGFYAMNRPGLATLVIAKVVGILVLASGIVLFISAVFGKARQHRLLDFLMATLRIVVGLFLVANLIKTVLVLTLVLGSVFLVEGIFGIVLGLKLRGKNPAWGWVVVSGVASLVLGGMLIAQFPSSALWAIGLLFGINCLFTGFSLIMYGTALPKAQEA